MNRPLHSSHRHSSHRRHAWAGLAATAAMVGALLAALPSQAAPTPEPATAVSAPLAGPVSITLVTGDVLRVAETADGRLTVARAGADEDPAAFARFTDAAGDLHVVPARLLPLIPGRLDPRLFNVSALRRDGYGAGAARRGLPLVITYTGPAVAVPGLEVRRALPSIGGAAASLVGDGTLLGRTLAGAGADRFLAGVEKIWLDGPVAASLDESVPQIGAPAAWEQGYDGTGVTIAVVDTGIDEGHPDLAGRVTAAEVFSDAPGVTDVFGHGTHVASITAGNGEASDGQYTGVAYGAELVNAKVLDDFGSGLETWVIAGMEWAATDQNADIVNMSLNGGPSDGTDPVSQAVNNLSASEGALFVTSAGNFGGFPESIQTPATAEAALAVAAVDKSDNYADFSGQGPVLDGTRVKPEIAAPGLDITAARADGAEIGPPVGEDYMELSGTSMASPHVAGAAALLLQANPGWSWDQLKNTLVTSALDVGATVFQQGGGRVDVAAALDQFVHSDMATVDLGVLEFPHDDGETSTVDVTLTNAGDADVTLDLAVTAVNEAGDSAGAMITVDPATLDVSTGESRTVAVTFDPQDGPIGLFGGVLTATFGGVESLHVPLSFQKEPELVDLTIEVIERDGADDFFGIVNVQNVDDLDTFFAQFEVFAGMQTVTARVPLGTYGVSLLSAEFVGFSGLDLVAVAEPEFAVVGPTEITLDSNQTTQIEVDVAEDVATLDTTVSVYRASEQGPFGIEVSTGGSGFEPMRGFANSTEPVTLGAFEFFSKWTLESPSRHYDLIFPEPDAIPESLSYEVGPEDVATIENSFHADVERTYLDGRFFFRPYSFISFIGLAPVDVPVVRQDWVTADDTRWAEIVDIGGDEGFATMDEDLTVYEPGEERAQSWVEHPTRPWFRPGAGPVRFDDTLAFYVPPWSDQANHVGYDFFAFEGTGPDTFRLAVTVDGEEVGEVTTPYGEFPLPPEPADVEVTLDAARDAPWWEHSTTTTTTWRFESEPTGPDLVPVPLVQVDYQVDLDLENETDAPNPLGFRAYGPDGGEVSAFRAWWSIDDGESWTPLELTDPGDGSFESTVPVPATCDPSCFVSLRVEADLAEVTALEQEIIRAYTARYVAPTPPPTTPPTDPPTTPPTDPPTSTQTPTPTPTTTLPGTGGGDAGWLAGIGLGVLVLGGLVVVLARRRLTRQD